MSDVPASTFPTKPMRARGGRPKVDEADRRKPRTLPCSDTEYDILVEAAELRGSNFAAYTREAALRQARKDLAKNKD